MRRTLRPALRAGLALVATALLAALPIVSPSPQGAMALTPDAAPKPGYWLVGGDGSVYSYGSAGALGSLRGTPLARPIAGMAPTPTGAGYWLVGTDGGIFSYGDAKFFGSTGALSLNQPIVGMAATQSGKGYWFVAADGGIFSFGDAKFYGSTGDVKLNKPIVGMAPTPSGKGYWFVASDGGIFSFGDAKFYGSTGGSSLPAGIVVMAGVNPAGASPSGTDSSTTTAPSGPTGSTQPTTPTTTTEPPPTGAAFEIGLVGDSGYAAGQDEVFEDVIEQMNTRSLAFVVHDGDIKDQPSPCSDSRLTKVKGMFNRSKAPFVYTPGDNEWMDCTDPIGRLQKLRETFFASDQSLGQTPMPLTTQRQDNYPENARWVKEGVVFATINAPGPTDNLPYDVDNPGTPEAGPRRVANLNWLRQTFETAKAGNAPAVMIIWQADPWTPTFRRTWDYLMDELRAQTLAFGKPVVLVHGDSHIHHVDKGGWQTKTGVMDATWDDVPNFTRVETWAGGAFSGSNTETHPDKWVRVTVDPKSPAVFTFIDETAP